MILALGILARVAGRRAVGVGGLVHLLLLVGGPTFLEECQYVHDQISERRRERDSFLGKKVLYRVWGGASIKHPKLCLKNPVDALKKPLF